VLAAQAFLTALGSVQEQRPWHLALMITAFVPLALMVVSLLTGVLVRATHGVRRGAVRGLLRLAHRDGGSRPPPDSPPWVWYS
jgi:hypothetical protein